jgi:hypothetical protein
VKRIAETNSSFNKNTIRGAIWNLDAVYPAKVYKPSKGLCRLLEHKPAEGSEEIKDFPLAFVVSPKIKEADFYSPFADWLMTWKKEVTNVISLGGSRFEDKCGTPDVIGKKNQSVVILSKE